MKKTMKRFASLALAMALAVSMAIGAFADDKPYTASDGSAKHTITISPSNDQTTAGTESNHTYLAFQIFKGSLSTDGEMGDIKWGDDVSSSAASIAADLLADNTLKSLFTGKTAADLDAATIAKALDKQTEDSAIAQAFAAIVGKYITADDATYTSTWDADAKANKITDVPTGYYFIKDKASEQNDKENGSQTRFILKVVGDATATAKDSVPSVDKEITNTDTDSKDYGDYNIGDQINYSITATLPSKYTDFKKYYLQFNDTMSTGLTPVMKDGKVDYTITAKNSALNLTSAFTVNYDADTNVITWTCNDLKDVETAATLTNSDTIVLTYSAYLNENANVGNEGNKNTAKLVFSNNPNQSGDGTPDTSETPEDETVVFTFNLDGDKIDGGTNAKLDGVEFKLYKSATEYYKWDDTNKKVTWVSEADAQVFKTASGGNFEIPGLDRGTYFLKETKALPGYNTIADQEITITPTYEKAEGSKIYQITDLTSKMKEAGKADATATDGTISTDKGTATHTIENNKGPVLPSTGGIGTTIFYVVGGVLVIGAAVLLVTKRRMGAEE